MRVDRTNLASLKAYRARLLLALEHADHLSPVAAYQKALHRADEEIRALERNAQVAEPFRALLNDFFARPKELRS